MGLGKPSSVIDVRFESLCALEDDTQTIYQSRGETEEVSIEKMKLFTLEVVDLKPTRRSLVLSEFSQSEVDQFWISKRQIVRKEGGRKSRVLFGG